MTKYVTLLRGINVGGNNKIEMPKLKKNFETLGFKNVVTYINSGNIIFESSETSKNLIPAIETLIEKNFGFKIRVVIRDAKNIQKLCKEIPSDWTNDKDQKTDVLFLWDEFNKKSSIDLIKINPEIDSLKYVDGAIIWNLKKENYSQSGMNKFIGTTIYKNMTARNSNTVRKLGELMK